MTDVRKTVTREGVLVEVGQTWRDLDKRSRGRMVKITRVDNYNGLAHYEQPVKNRLRIDRMHRPYWELVKEPTP